MNSSIVEKCIFRSLTGLKVGINIHIIVGGNYIYVGTKKLVQDI
jgi:hypothetical protein